MSMQSVCLEGFGGEKEIEPWLQETTLIQQIFGGRLKSKVINCDLYKVYVVSFMQSLYLNGNDII